MKAAENFSLHVANGVQRTTSLAFRIDQRRGEDGALHRVGSGAAEGDVPLVSLVGLTRWVK